MTAFDPVAFDADAFDAGASTPTMRLQGALLPSGAVQIDEVSQGFEISGRLAPSGIVNIVRLNMVRVDGRMPILSSDYHSLWVEGLISIRSVEVNPVETRGLIQLLGELSVDVGLRVSIDGHLSIEANPNPCWCGHG